MSLVTVEGLTSGTWDMSFSGKADARRFVSGSLNGTVYDAMLTQGSGDDQFGCDWQITASLTLGRLSGSYASRPARGCPERTGTIDLIKQ